MDKPSSARRNLAENLRIIRLLRNLSQEDLAELTGLHRTYISAIERCERNIGLDALTCIADGLGMSISELFTDPDPQEVAEQLLEAIRGRPVRIKERSAVYSSAGLAAA